MKNSLPSPSFASLVQVYFCERLLQQQNASTNTVASYRDTFRLLLGYLQKCKHKNPSDVLLTDLDAPTVLAFLDDLEKRRRNTIRTRNARLATMRSFMRYAASCDPIALPIAQAVLAIPRKRFAQPLLGYLTREEISAILEAPNQEERPSRMSGLTTRLESCDAAQAAAAALRGIAFPDVLGELQCSAHGIQTAGGG